MIFITAMNTQDKVEFPQIMSQPISLLQIDDIEDHQTQEFQLDAQALFAVKKDGQLYLYENTCPHLQITLNFTPNQFLDQEGYFIMCANHGALFEIETGLCISGPCLGKSLTRIPFEIQNGQLQIKVN